MSNDWFARGGFAFLGAMLVMIIWSYSDVREAEKNLFDFLSEPTEEQKIQALCIEGNANACKVYEVRFSRKCLL